MSIYCNTFDYSFHIAINALSTYDSAWQFSQFALRLIGQSFICLNSPHDWKPTLPSQRLIACFHMFQLHSLSSSPEGLCCYFALFVFTTNPFSNPTEMNMIRVEVLSSSNTPVDSVDWYILFHVNSFIERFLWRPPLPCSSATTKIIQFLEDNLRWFGFRCISACPPPVPPPLIHH